MARATIEIKKGMKIGRWTVVSFNKERSTTKRKYWNCICECGTEKPVLADHLRKAIRENKIISCGCYAKEINGERFKQMNDENWKNEDYRKRKIEEIRECFNGNSFAEGHKLTDETKHRISESRKGQCTGEDAYNWKGGISNITTYLRGYTRSWIKNVRKIYNNKCDITGIKCTYQNSTVHHLYPFKNVVEEAHIANNVQVKPQIKDYTDEELELLKDYVIEWHNNNIDKGVLLLKTVHKQFHDEFMGHTSIESSEEDYLKFKEQFNDTKIG